MKSSDPSDRVRTRAIPRPSSEGGSMTIAKGRVFILTPPISWVSGASLCALKVPLPVAGKINALATLHRQRRHAAHLILIRDAAVIRRSDAYNFCRAGIGLLTFPKGY